MKKIKLYILFVNSILFYLLIFCKNYQNFPDSCFKIEGIPGPEDFVYLEEENIFLISSHNRRDFDSYGEIFSYNPNNNKLHLIKRINEPENLSFRPHGIDYYKPFLFVILHGNSDNSKWHAVAIYEFKNEILYFKMIFQHPLIYYPNDLIILNEKEFFITNDMKTYRSFLEAIGTIYFNIKKGSIVHCNIQQSECDTIYDGLGFPNSLLIINDQLFVSTTLENKIYKFKIIKNNNKFKLTSKKEIAKVVGPDNLILFKNKIYVTSHASMWKFIRHSNNTENLSPSIGYEIDPISFEVQKIFEDSGSRISAASVIIKINSELFIGQVFDPFLLRCKSM
jgi:hypothetical protein